MAMRLLVSSSYPAPTVLSSVGGGFVLLGGVLLAGWDVWTVLAVYWLENVALGLFNLPRMVLARGPLVRTSVGSFSPRGARWIGWLAMPLFAFHYGAFCLVHGLFVLVILPGAVGIIELDQAFDLGAAPVAGEALVANGALIGMAGLLELRDWVRTGQARTASVGELMTAPYRRVVLLHLVLLIGGIAISATGEAVPLVVVLIVAKVAYDLRGAAPAARTAGARATLES